MFRHLAVKSIFERLGHIFPPSPPPPPPKQCWFFNFFDCTDLSAYTTLNWGAGGIRELTLDANKLKHVLKYRKASLNIAIFWRLFGFDFNFLQFPSVKFSDMLKTGIVWQEETFKIEKSRGCQGSFFVFSIFVFFGWAKTLSYKFFW